MVMRVVFMGSSEFAIPAIKLIFANPSFEIVAIYTKQPAKSGRGQKLNHTAVGEYALQNNIPLYMPEKFTDAEIIEFQNLKPDFTIVTSYALILPQKLLDIARFGSLNIHPSLLPRWRGAAPIHRAIMEGDTKTGIAIIKMTEKLDAGDILSMVPIPMGKGVTYSILSQILADLGAKILVDTMKNLSQIAPVKQEEKFVTYAKKIDKVECRINWKEDVSAIYRKILALGDNIGIYFYYNGVRIKIIDAVEMENNIYRFDKARYTKFGTIIDENFSILCNNGVIRPIILQKEGGKRLKLDDFLNGMKFAIGDVLE